MKDEDGDVECHVCMKGLKFIKRKESTKEWPDENGYSDWKCTNKKCSDYGDTQRLFDNGDCEVLDSDDD